jgi:hypothetical protein
MFGHIPEGFYQKQEEERKELAREQLRDQFAMAALVGMLPSISSSNWKKIAEHSYEVADAMLEARKEKK